jgi:hypothetical protein
VQAACYNLLLAEGWPSADEASLMRWAANSNVVSPPKHASRQLYKQATALEALVRAQWQSLMLATKQVGSSTAAARVSSSTRRPRVQHVRKEKPSGKLGVFLSITQLQM